MDSVNIADLKNNLSRHLLQVREGSEITVFDRDTPVARIVPYRPRPAARGRRPSGGDYWTEARVDLLERQGVIRRPDATVPPDVGAAAPPIRLPKSAPSLVQTLLNMRRESAR
jgi:prevent-host-death family protein